MKRIHKKQERGEMAEHEEENAIPSFFLFTWKKICSEKKNNNTICENEIKQCEGIDEELKFRIHTKELNGILSL